MVDNDTVIHQRTVWCAGYDSPSVLTPEDVVQKLVYIYTNPAKDNLIDSISEYPNLSSWDAFGSGTTTISCPWIRRPQVEKLSKASLSQREQDELTQTLIAGTKLSHDFFIEPNAWMEYFRINDSQEIERINKTIKTQITAVEAECRRVRIASGSLPLGREAMILQPINKPYEPQRTGKRTWCHCSNIPLRILFLMLVKALVKKGREVLERWRRWDFSEQYPIGLYPPALPKRGNHLTKVVLSTW